jgi:NADH dehydrogenase
VGGKNVGMGIAGSLAALAIMRCMYAAKTTAPAGGGNEAGKKSRRASAQAATARPRIIVVGCGFAGLEATRALARAAVDITLIDSSNHHLFQPLLYQVATAGLPAPSIAAPIRHILRRQPNVTVLLATVVGIDPSAREVRLSDGQALEYEHLIVAAGATNSYFGHADWARHAPGLKTLDDAFAIRKKVLFAFEAAERLSNAADRDRWLTFVVIGGGPTGVEMAGTLAEIARRTLPGEFRRFDPAAARILLIEGGPRLLSHMPESLSAKARRQLEALGVEVRTHSSVTTINAQGLEIKNVSTAATISATSYFLESKCVIWGAGVAAVALGRVVADACGVEVDKGGRVQVEPDLSLACHPEISVVGDLAAARSYAPGKEPKPVPGVSPAAKQMGQTAAANILCRIAGGPTRKFRYRNYGDLATIGRGAAVVDLSTPVGPLRFSGLSAWLFWLFAHIYFLIGFRNRFSVLMDWASAYWGSERAARVVSGIHGEALDEAVESAPSPGSHPRPD